MSAIQDLRSALERRFPDAIPLGRGLAPSVATGIAALDGVLPGSGLARGRLTAWRPGGGATAILCAAAEAAIARGERAAWIDTAGVQSADFVRKGVLLVRPENALAALRAGEELLRSGGFALVVLSGAGREAGREAVRLARSARAGGSAFVLVTDEPAISHLRVESKLSPGGYRWRRNPFGEPVEAVAVRVEVEASSLGWSGRASFELPVRTHGARVAPEPRLVDRRGAPPAARWRRVRRAERERAR